MAHDHVNQEQESQTARDCFVVASLSPPRLEKCKTLPARRMKEPTWMYHCEVDILAPNSMIRIQVKDDRPTEKADIGFLDIAVGDIPYDKVPVPREKTYCFGDGSTCWKKFVSEDVHFGMHSLSLTGMFVWHPCTKCWKGVLSDGSE